MSLNIKECRQIQIYMGILDLQKANLPEFLSSEEMRSQGFLTVKHSFTNLQKLNDNRTRNYL